nr:CBS domain-containing protein [Pseudopedobacter sp.]
MIAGELISDVIPPIKTSDPIKKVFNRMSEFKVNHLPIVNNQQFLGLISEDDLIEVADENTPIGSLNLTLVNPYVLENQHIYDVIRVFYEQKLTVVPVLDDKMNYLGLISINSLLEYFASITLVGQTGAIIVLEINNRDNSLAHIAQIVESENAQILSSYTRNITDSTKMEVTIKVNKTDISQIVASFLRYEYVVLATYNYSDKNGGVSDRFDSLMNYLSF